MVTHPWHLLPIVVALLSPISVGAQVSSFQGLWFGEPTDSGARRRVVRVAGLHVQVTEECLPAGDRECRYEADAIPYSLLSAPAGDSTVIALVVEYGRPGWRQTLILRPVERRRLEAFIYTRFLGAARRTNVYEHQLLSSASYRMRPPPTAGPPIPQFPWPPPTPTVSLRLPDSLVAVPGNDSLGAVFDRLRGALARVDVGWWSVYAIGADGFAVVTRMEAIDPDGRPKSGAARWSTPNDRMPERFSGVVDYVKALFFARPGFYRIIVLAVTDLPSQPSGQRLSADSAGKLVTGGSDQLPSWLRRVPLGIDGRCVALIYEFERPAEGDSARLVTSALIAALQHLTLAGLWTEQELRK